MKYQKTIMGWVAAILLAGTTASAQPAPKPEEARKPDSKVRKTIVYKDGQLLEMEGGAAFFETMAGKGFLGVQVVELTRELRTHFGVAADAGVLVSKVEAESPAARAGLQAGDIITAIDGKKISSATAVTRGVRNRKEGERVTLEVSRNRAPLRLTATLEERDVPFRQFKMHLPEGKLLAGPMADEAVDKLQTYLKSPEWRARIEQLGDDCKVVQTRIRDLETRMKELEKRLEKK